MKVYILEGGHDYEGFSILHVASSKKLAKQWRDKHLQYRNPYPDDPKWPGKAWCFNSELGYIGYYDSLDIEEFILDGGLIES